MYQNLRYKTLGRIHYLAFINKAPFAWVSRVLGKLPDVAPDWLLSRRWEEEGEKSPELDNQKLADHAKAAVRNFRRAIELAPENGLYYLGLASLLEQYTQWAEATKLENAPEEFKDLSQKLIRDTYYRAYELSIREDLKLNTMPIAGLKSLVGHEAGRAYLRLVESDQPGREQEKERIAKVKKDLEKLEGLPWGAITPIICSFGQHRGLRDLLAPGLQVPFDLDGDGTVELRPWVKPITGILVWDPDRKGRITSGRQLFGSVSWWLFFADGYQALDALDDNRDGRLTGTELTGIAIWFDRDSNGQSDPGEVLPLEALRIAAVATKSQGRDQDAPMNRSGLLLQDGRTLPSYDWMTEPLTPSRHGKRPFPAIVSH